MVGLNFCFLLLFIGVSLNLMRICVPFIQGKVALNPISGVRTSKTLADENVWYPANAFCGRILFVAGLLQLISVIALFLVPSLRVNPVAYNIVCGAVFIISLLAASAWILLYVKSL